MRKTLVLVASIGLLFSFASCSGLFPARGDATVIIQLGGSSARALSGAPFAGLPVLSSYSITVSGPGMETVTYTIPGSSPSFSASIPAGPERTIELYAPVDWVATDGLINPGNPTTPIPLPTLVKAYGAKSTLDLSAGKTVNVAMRLVVAETKILLPDAVNDAYLISVDSILNPGTPSSNYYGFLSEADFEFDRYGRLLISTENPIRILDNINNENITIINAWGTSMAIDYTNNRLFILGDGQILMADLNLASPISAAMVSQPSGASIEYQGLAVDGVGNIYVSSVIDNVSGLVKFSMINPESYIFTSKQALGIASLTIKDLAVKDGKLYVLAAENVWNGSTIHHGKLLELQLDDLSVSRVLGASSGTYPGDPDTQFYGPQRFIAIAPRKLIISDEGLLVGNNDIDRVVQVDIPSWTIEMIGLEGQVNFFRTYSVC